MKRLILFLLALFFLNFGLAFSQSQIISIEHRWPDSLKGEQHNVKCILVKDNIIFVGTGRNYMWVSTDTGKSWDRRDWRHGLNAPFGTIFALAVTPSGRILAGTEEGVYMSINNGNNWQRVAFNERSSFFLISQSGAIFSGFDGIFKSTNNGLTWTQIADTSIAGGIRRMVQTPSGIIVAGSISPFLETVRGIIRSTNGGQTWYFSNTGLIGWAKSIVDMAAWPDGNSEVLIATYLDGIYRSPDAGITWQKINEIKEPLGDAVGILPPLGVFAAGGGTVDGVWRNSLYQLKSNGWERIAPEYMQNFIVISLAKFDNQRLLIGTNDGLLLMTFNINTTSVEEPAAPISYKLNQNYPNPFNSSTTISFTIPNSEFVTVTLKVYDVLGREVATLVNENLSAGSYSYNFDASNLTSGVYFYKLQAGRYSETKKMILMK